MTAARSALSEFEKEVNKFNGDPVVREVSARTIPPLWQIPYLGNMLIRLNRDVISSMIHEALERKISSIYGRHIEGDYDITNAVNYIQVVEWGRLHNELFSPFRGLLDQLDKITEKGSGTAARLYISGFTSMLPKKSAASRNNPPEFLVDTLPRMSRRFDFLLRLIDSKGIVGAYINLGKMNAVALYNSLEEENRQFEGFGIPKQINFAKPILVADELHNVIKTGINVDTLTTLVKSVPIGRRNYCFGLLSNNPEYVNLFESINSGLFPEAYTSFLTDYANVPITINEKPTSAFEVVKEVAAKNKMGAVWLIRNPVAWESNNLSLLLQKLDQPLKTRDENAPAKTSQYSKYMPPVQIVSRKGISWFDTIFPEGYPNRDAIKATYQKLARLKGEYRLKYVPSDKLDEFCQHVQELPTPLLVNLVRDNDLFEAYISKLGDKKLLETLRDIPLKGENFYNSLYEKLKPPETLRHLLSLADRILPQEEIDKNSKYQRIVVWGDIKSIQRQEIQAKFNGTTLRFVDPLTDSSKLPVATDATVFILRRGKSHPQYNAAKDFYTKRNIDIYPVGRQVGAGSIAKYIRNIQKSYVAA